jgi:hypothetical protein
MTEDEIKKALGKGFEGADPYNLTDHDQLKKKVEAAKLDKQKEEASKTQGEIDFENPQEEITKPNFKLN